MSPKSKPPQEVIKRPRCKADDVRALVQAYLKANEVWSRKNNGKRLNMQKFFTKNTNRKDASRFRKQVKHHLEKQSCAKDEAAILARGWDRPHNEDADVQMVEVADAQMVEDADAQMVEDADMQMDLAEKKPCDDNCRGAYECDACRDKLNMELFKRFETASKNLLTELNNGSGTKLHRPEPITFKLEDAIAASVEHWVCDVTQFEGFEETYKAQYPNELRVSCAVAQSRHFDKKSLDKITRGVPPSDFLLPEHRLYQAPGDRSLQLVHWIVFQGNDKATKKEVYIHNYAFLDEVPYSNQTVVKIAKDTSEAAKKSSTYRRAGGAGGPEKANGPHEHACDPECLSKQTRINRQYLLPAGNSAAPTISYKRAKPKPGKERNAKVWIRSDIPGRATSAAAKRQRMLDESDGPHYREWAIKQCQSRFTIQMLTLLYEPPKQTDFPDLPKKLDNDNPQGIWLHLNEAIRDMKRWKETWLGVDPKLTDWEILMLEYSLQVGELVNYVPVAAHKDTSEGHIIQTLELVARVVPDDCTIKDSQTMARECARMVGQVMLPYQDHGYLLRPGRDVLHANFTFTIHVPDHSRGSRNASKVGHGPPLGQIFSI